MQGKQTFMFGSYPQTRVKDETLVKQLNTAAGALPVDGDFGKWTSYRFYMAGKKSDYMWYVDISHGGEKYRGVYIKEERPFSSDGDSSDFDQRGHQGYFGYYRDKVYWFKYEPIEFCVLEDDGGTVFAVSKYALDAMQFSNAHLWQYVEYKDSEIRAWLNSEFVNTAFNGAERAALIDSTELNDRAFLLSVEEHKTNSCNGGFRQSGRYATDYALGLGVDAESAYGICNFAWLRTVGGEDDDPVFYGIGTLGEIDRNTYSANRIGGVIVGIRITKK